MKNRAFYHVLVLGIWTPGEKVSQNGLGYPQTPEYHVEGITEDKT
jgi:hypothetical protein